MTAMNEGEGHSHAREHLIGQKFAVQDESSLFLSIFLEETDFKFNLCISAKKNVNFKECTSIKTKMSQSKQTEIKPKL